MEKSFEYRIYPSAEQRRMIAQTFGCCRYVYNQALSISKDAYEKNEKVPSIDDYIEMMCYWRANPETIWLKDVPITALQNSLRDLDCDWEDFFRSLRKVDFPKFKTKRDRYQTYRINNINNYICIEDTEHVYLPKLGSVKTCIPQISKECIISAVVKKVPSEKYFIILYYTNCIE